MTSWHVLLDFVIFSISDGFGLVSLWISNPSRDFLPGDGSRSQPGWNFIQNNNFIKDVTGRNKTYQKYQLWAPDEFIIPPSSRALALHALIISLKPSGKIIKLQNECTEFSHNVKLRSKLFNSSFNFDLKTSCALPPYYSLELDPISSTSHSNLSRGPGSRFTWFAASAERKCIFEVEKSMNPDVLACFSSFSHFLNFPWFFDGLTINFNFLAGFLARGCSRIARALNFHSKWQFC